MVSAVQKDRGSSGEPSPPGFTHTVLCLTDLGLQPCPSRLDTTPNHDLLPEVRVSIRIRTRALLSQWECGATLANLKGGALLRREVFLLSRAVHPPRTWPRAPK